MAVGCLLLAGPWAAPGIAQRTQFRPEIAVDQRYSDNVTLAPEGGESDDTSTSITLVLPVERQGSRGTFSLLYSGSYQRFQEFEALDNSAHAVALGVVSKPSERSTVEFDATVSRSIDQGDPRSVRETDLFLSRRRERDGAIVTFAFLRDLTARWQWGFEGLVEAYQFEEIDGFDDGLPPDPAEDRLAYGGSVQLLRKLSRQASFGVGYERREFDLDVSGEETVDTVSLIYRREVSERVSADLALGYFSASGEAIERVSPAGEDSEEGVHARITVNRYFRHSLLEIEGQHTASVGGDLPGSATTSYLQLGIRSREERNFGWDLYARYGRRDPVDDLQPELDSVAGGATLARSITRKLWLRVGGSYIVQSASDGDLDTSVLEGSLGLVLYPKGRGEGR